MPIIACPQCRTQLDAPAEVLGQQVICGQCGRKFIAAEAAPPSAAQPGHLVGSPAAPQRPARSPAASGAAPEGPPPPGVPAPAEGPTPAPPAAEAPAAAPGRAWPPPPLPPGPPQPAQPAYAPAAPLPTSGLAVASLVLGIISIVFCMGFLLVPLVCGILAVAFGGRAIEQHVAGAVSDSSLGLARAGRACGTIGIVLGGLFFALFFCGPLAAAL